MLKLKSLLTGAVMIGCLAFVANGCSQTQQQTPPGPTTMPPQQQQVQPVSPAANQTAAPMGQQTQANQTQAPAGQQ